MPRAGKAGFSDRLSHKRRSEDFKVSECKRLRPKHIGRSHCFFVCRQDLPFYHKWCARGHVQFNEVEADECQTKVGELLECAVEVAGEPLTEGEFNEDEQAPDEHGAEPCRTEPAD